jgi:methyl-accepting chemotaxis protein
MRRWLGSRRVYTKILIVAAVAIAGTVATGVFALAGIADLSNTRNDEVGNSVPYITALNEAALTAKAAANDERGFLLRGDASFRDEALGRKADVDAALRSAAAIADPSELRAVEEIQAATDAWFAALQATCARHTKGCSARRSPARTRRWSPARTSATRCPRSASPSRSCWSSRSRSPSRWRCTSPG